MNIMSRVQWQCDFLSGSVQGQTLRDGEKVYNKYEWVEVCSR